MMNEYRIEENDQLRLATFSAVAADLRAQARVVYDDGTTDTLLVGLNTTGTSRVQQNFDSGASYRARKDGYVVSAIANFEASGATPKRGQTYGVLQILNPNQGLIMGRLARGYVYGGAGLSLGQDDEALSGKGYLRWVQEANDAAGNVVTTVNLAATNVRRIVRGIIVKYHQVGGAAATITITLRDLADSGGPTNWSIDSDTWVSPDLVLGANQEGLIHVGEHGFLSTNDAGVLAYADNTTAPNPFPLVIDEGDPVDLLIAASGGASGDDYDVWIQYEEWIEI